MNKIKQSFIQTKMIAVAMLLLSACGQEDEYVPKGDSEILSQGIEITVSAGDFVTDGAPDTRATDNGKETTFENDDRVGIIILDENETPIYDNIPYKYNDGKWTFDSGNDDGKGECYYDPKAKTFIVYYPYSRAADEVTGVNDLKIKLAPKFNQNDIEDYRSSDLMVWSSSSLPSPVKELNVELTHAFASVFLAPTVGKFVLEDGTAYKGSYVPEVSDISDVSLTIDNAVYVPYQAIDGTLCCIIPSNITAGNIRCFYTFGSKTFVNTISISGVPNIRYISAPTIENVPYSLGNAHVGDYYCKNSDGKGYLIPGNQDPLPNNLTTVCIGVVCWVGSEAYDEDPLLKKKHPDCTHGLVVALKDAGSGINWSNNSESVQKNWVKTNNQYKDVVNLEEHYKMCGYSNTLALVEYNNAKGENSDYRVLPCDAIQQYSTTNSAPINSSGWYFPSLTELKYLCWGQKQDQGIIGRNILNTHINQVGGISLVSGDYWSSTEDSSFGSTVWYVYFSDGRLYHYNKGYGSKFRIRPLLAF